jgi:hypothetical protein
MCRTPWILRIVKSHTWIYPLLYTRVWASYVLDFRRERTQTDALTTPSAKSCMQSDCISPTALHRFLIVQCRTLESKARGRSLPARNKTPLSMIYPNLGYLQDFARPVAIGLGIENVPCRTSKSTVSHEEQAQLLFSPTRV